MPKVILCHGGIQAGEELLLCYLRVGVLRLHRQQLQPGTPLLHQ